MPTLPTFMRSLISYASVNFAKMAMTTVCEISMKSKQACLGRSVS